MSTPPVPARRRKLWGWGYEGERASASAVAFAESALSALLGGGPLERREPPSEDAIQLAPGRALPPASLAAFSDTSTRARALHALGRSYRDLARATRGVFPHPPDAVLFPRTEAEVAQVLEAASSARVAVVPFGGGTSVSGGVEPIVGGAYRGAWSLDLTAMSGVVEIDHESLAARVLAGTLGPDLEHALRPSGLSLRHFPQSFEMSTLGGWIATRAGGHFATVYTHIDDLVEAIRVVTPSGTLATRRLPGSGAGPQPERMFVGSEGALGIITEAWVRLFQRPRHRASATLRFADFMQGARAVRAIVQSGLQPANARLLDGPEAIMSGTGAGDAALLLLAFESAELSQDALLAQAIDVARAHGAALPEGAVRSTETDGAGREATADAYKGAFFRAPYLRDELVLRGIFVETYETAVPWSGLQALDAAVRAAVASLELGPSFVAARLTHVYRDGAAPYYTVICRAPDRGEVALADRVKDAVTRAIVEAGGTSTHHHAVGRDVVPYYERERPDLFARALEAAKRALDPNGVMNPGALLRDPSAAR